MPKLALIQYQWNRTLFTQDTPPPGGEGGLRNAFFGSALMSLLGILIGHNKAR